MDTKHILIAEDEENTRLSLSLFLKKAGYNVTTAKDGREALKKIIELKKSYKAVDLLLTDISMPDMSGIELIDELEKNEISIPILVITGYGNKEMILDLMRKGCSDYIEKPFNAQKLIARLPLIFEKQEKAMRIKEKETEWLIQQQAELTMKAESYLHCFENMREQIELAITAYQNLVHIREDECKVSVAYRHQPISELGGDFIDIRNTPTGCDLLLADVAGHDMGASYHTVMIKAFFDENCRKGNNGEFFFQLLNQQLLENGKNERMVTAIFLRLNLESMEGEVLSAGHPPIISLSKEMPVPGSIKPKGDILGIYEKVAFESRSFSISSGERLFLYTDGLTNVYRFNVEKMRKEKLGSGGLENLINKYRILPIKDMIENIWKEITYFESYKFNDDILFFGIEIP